MGSTLVRKGVVGFLICVVSLWLSQGVKARSLDGIASAGNVKIAVPLDFAPFGSMGPDGKPEGYDVDVAKLIAKDLGVKLELVPVTSANRIPYLQTDKVDMVISSLGVNPQRAMAISFSQAYAPFFSGVFGPRHIQIRSAADLAGKSLGVTRGTLEDLEISKMAPKGAKVVRYEDNATTIAALLSDKVEVIATGNFVAAAVAKQNPDKLTTKFIIKNSPCHIGVQRGNVDLLNWLNVFIYHKKLGGELNKLSKKWFGEPLPKFPKL
jgi:polar amino acid transport system substrate-binding protein